MTRERMLVSSAQLGAVVVASALVAPVRLGMDV